MKLKTFYSYLALLFACLIFLWSCKKTESKETNSFTWTYDGTNYKANFDSVYMFGSITFQHLIIAGTGPNRIVQGSGPTFAISSLEVGSYTYGVDNVFLSYTDSLNNRIFATSVTLNITSNKHNRLSGNFFSILTNNKNLTGNFNYVPIKQ